MKQPSIVSTADSYKYSQPSQYPLDVVSMYDYVEARGGEYSKVVWDGMQYYVKAYLMNPITFYDVEKASRKAEKHGEPFDYDGWMYIVEKHKGFLPIRVKSIPEGSVVPTQIPLSTIESTDKKVFWVAGFVETLLMKVWYPTTIASKSYAVRKMLEGYAEKYSDSLDGVAFQYHNFGDRGSSSVESAAIGGMAHLTQFFGTDNFNCLDFIEDYYDVECAGYSIVASEHSTVTSWGKSYEFNMIEHHLETHKARPIIACVLDSYDIYNATRKVTSGEFKRKIESDDYPTFVMRPDSGDAVEVVTGMLEICNQNNVAYTINSKELKVMKKYRIIYGDGISPAVIAKILDVAISMGYAPDNFAFGSGGDLMQNVNRDTCKFAIKCSNVILADGTMREVFKDPITDSGKKSKKGRVTTFINKDGDLRVGSLDDETVAGEREFLEVVYDTGVLGKTYNFDEVRANSRKEYKLC